ncbi:Uncharacterised protein [uncultured archaeon]|nr:Uncharacterised protein [uncultured archaeon]
MLNVLVGPPTTSTTVGIVGEKPVIIVRFPGPVDPRAFTASFASVEDSLSILFTFTGLCTPQLPSDDTICSFQYASAIILRLWFFSPVKALIVPNASITVVFVSFHFALVSACIFSIVALKLPGWVPVVWHPAQVVLLCNKETFTLKE